MAIVLIGNTVNDYIEEILATSVNPLTRMFVSPDKVPTVEVKGMPLPVLLAGKEFSRSEYFI